MNHRHVSWSLWLGAFCIVGCGQVSPPPTNGSGCNLNPFACPSGTTCWLRDNEPTFACLRSGTANEGEHCFDQVGIAQCVDGLTCLQLDSSGGVCRQYCDPLNPAHGCPTGQHCSHGSVNVGDAGVSEAGAIGAEGFNVCVPTL
jgi:hypothetical protein